MRLTALVLDYGGVLTDLDGALGEPPLVPLLRTVRSRGIRTALLSNADDRGELPAPEVLDLDPLCDEVVISGEVGVRKPDPAIYELTAQRLGVPVGECVFVDDLPGNVRGAVAAGMVGVLHADADSTIGELGVLFALPD